MPAASIFAHDLIDHGPLPTVAQLVRNAALDGLAAAARVRAEFGDMSGASALADRWHAAIRAGVGCRAIGIASLSHAAEG